MVVSTSETNTLSLKPLEEFVSARIKHTITIIGKVAEHQATVHTQLDTFQTNIAMINNTNILLSVSDNLHNKINYLTNHVASLTNLIDKQLGVELDSAIDEGTQQMLIAYTHHNINDLDLLPGPLPSRNSHT